MYPPGAILTQRNYISTSGYINPEQKTGFSENLEGVLDVSLSYPPFVNCHVLLTNAPSYHERN